MPGTSWVERQLGLQRQTKQRQPTRPEALNTRTAAWADDVVRMLFLRHTGQENRALCDVIAVCHGQTARFTHSVDRHILAQAVEHTTSPITKHRFLLCLSRGIVPSSLLQLTEALALKDVYALRFTAIRSVVVETGCK